MTLPISTSPSHDRAGRAVAALAEVAAHGHEGDGDRAGGEREGEVGQAPPRDVRGGGSGHAGAVGQPAGQRRMPEQGGDQQHRAGGDDQRSALAQGFSFVVGGRLVSVAVIVGFFVLSRRQAATEALAPARATIRSARYAASRPTPLTSPEAKQYWKARPQK